MRHGKPKGKCAHEGMPYEEFIMVFGSEHRNLSKHRLNKKASEEIKRFINSDFWKRILKEIKACEDKIDK